MLGSYRSCSNCGATNLRKKCSDLIEYRAWTDTEEAHCVVSPDFLSKDIIDEDIEEDPYCTRGFITAFRMLSPLRDPVYMATARTFSGALAEMERLIGDAVYSGYVGYNGRQPGGARDGLDGDRKHKVKEEGKAGQVGEEGVGDSGVGGEGALPRDKEAKGGVTNNAVGSGGLSGGDARHTVVAYFQILELACMLQIPKDICDLAVRVFRHTASRTSLRNRNVEALATASLVCAVDRQRYHAGDADIGTSVTLSDIAASAGFPDREVTRYLRIVTNAMQRQSPETSASIKVHMPSFCRRLGLPEEVQECALGIADKVLKKNISARRNPMSISAASIYLACQLEDRKKTQLEICKVTGLTEVTLRKVNKELARNISDILPDGYEPKVDPMRTVPNSVKTESTQCELFREKETISCGDIYLYGCQSSRVDERAQTKEFKESVANESSSKSAPNAIRTVGGNAVTKAPTTTASKSSDAESGNVAPPKASTEVVKKPRSSAAGPSSSPTEASPAAVESTMQQPPSMTMPDVQTPFPFFGYPPMFSPFFMPPPPPLPPPLPQAATDDGKETAPGQPGMPPTMAAPVMPPGYPPGMFPMMFPFAPPGMAFAGLPPQPPPREDKSGN